jgi:hypothetical protein
MKSEVRRRIKSNADREEVGKRENGDENDKRSKTEPTDGGN